MITPSSGDTHELTEFFQRARMLARIDPGALAALNAEVDKRRAALKPAALSSDAVSIAKQFGRDVGEVALMRGAQQNQREADKVLLSRLPPHRIEMLKTFAGQEPAAQAQRARELGWT